MPNEIQGSDENLVYDLGDQEDSVEKFNYGDLYYLGKLWVDLLKIGLLGTSWKLIPVTEAATPPPPPQKPPPMRYKDLPLYNTPHFDYKDYVQSEESKPIAQAKTINDILLPHVTHYRQTVQCRMKDACAQYCSFKKELSTNVSDAKEKFKKFMRDPENLVVRQVVLGLGGVTGYWIGSGTPNIPKKVFFTSCGLLAAGALCFPKETDETFRDVTLSTAKFLLMVYNKFCGKNFSMGERLPCRDDLPGPPPRGTPKRKVNYCPTKK